MTWPPNLKRVLNRTDNPLVRCRCGRTANLDMMLDVSGLPADVRGPSTALCDSCVEGLFGTKKISREDFYRALGAPRALVVRAALRDAMEAL